MRAENECMPRSSCVSAVLQTLAKIFLPARPKSSADAKKILPSVNFAEKHLSNLISNFHFLRIFSENT